MADHDLLELYMAADQTPYWNVTTTPGGATPQTMTGFSLAFVIRDSKPGGSLVVSKATGGSGITIGDGNGTNDRATVTLAETDIPTSWPEGKHYRGSLWRTDVDVPIWDGVVWLRRAADQP